MKIEREFGAAAFIVIFVVLLSGCSRPVDKVREAAPVDNLDKVREAAIALKIALNHKGTPLGEFRPLIDKLAVEIAVANEKGEDSEALRRYAFAQAEIQQSYDSQRITGFWVVPLRAELTLEDALLIQRGQPPKSYKKLPAKDW
jgi:hypothetical protein